MYSFNDTERERWLQESGLLELIKASENVLERLDLGLALGEKLDLEPLRDAIRKARGS